MWGPVEERLLNGRLGKAIARVVGKPGSLRFRLPRATSQSIVERRNWDIQVGERAPLQWCDCGADTCPGKSVRPVRVVMISTRYLGPTTGYVCLTSGIELPVGTWTAGRYSNTLERCLTRKRAATLGD